MIGSHLDSVADAGRYDGILGILIGLEVADALPDAPLEVVAFADEDGLRFQSIYVGSRAFVGEPRRPRRCATAPASRCGEALDGELGAPLYDPATRAYFEVHIEQGPVLESEGLPLGVVTAIAGQSRFNLAFTGHAGPRRDDPDAPAPRRRRRGRRVRARRRARGLRASRAWWRRSASSTSRAARST